MSLRPSTTAVLLCGGLILLLSVGTRQTFGLFLQPMTADLGWGRETFAFAIALQNLIWGLGQPFAGVIADKYGAGRVLALGGLIYVAGLVLMAYSPGPLVFDLSAGIMIGIGLSGTGFGVVMGVVGRSVAVDKRSAALGLVGAIGSFGQFAMLPYSQSLISRFDWQSALLVMAASVALIMPLASVLAGKPSEQHVARKAQSVWAALHEAGHTRSFWFSTASLSVCGLQTTFIMIHLPAYLIDHHMTPMDGMAALATIGLFNVVGSYFSGILANRWSKKYLLVSMYLIRGIAIPAFVILPLSPLTLYCFAAALGITWLGTVPLTNGIVAQIFGVKYLSTLFGIVFLGHQIGAFIGAWYGGYIFDATGSYQTVWVFATLISYVAALLCWPIDERPLAMAGAK